MAPDQRGEVGEIVVADVHAVQPDLVDGFLHVDGVPVHDGIEGEAKGAKLLFLPLLKRASDFAALAMVKVLSALVPASIVGGSRSGFSQAACNTLKTVVVRRRKWSLR